MIDIADFAVAFAQLYGPHMIASARGIACRAVAPAGRGGVISAFQLPGGVWAWNAMIGQWCGDCVLCGPRRKPAGSGRRAENVNRVFERHACRASSI